MQRYYYSVKTLKLKKQNKLRSFEFEIEKKSIWKGINKGGKEGINYPPINSTQLKIKNKGGK